MIKSDEKILEKIKEFEDAIESSKKHECSRGQVPEMTSALKALKWVLED